MLISKLFNLDLKFKEGGDRMVIDVSNLDSMIRGYIINTVKEYYPDIDTSENSSFDDILIKPITKLLRPFVETVSRMELKLNLENAAHLTEEELDEIGEGNYFMPRKSGSLATTMLTLTFANLNIEDPDFAIRIPAGATFSTGSGVEFQTQSAIILSADDMRNAYNKAKLIYEIDIAVQATAIGSMHNVFAGEIIFCNTFFSSSLVSVVNKQDVTDGKDKEDNVSYAARIKEFYLSRQLGTAPGYKNFVHELFEEVQDVYVAGYKDPYMKRDILKVVEDITEEVYERHVGGAVDLYLKGCVYDQSVSEFTVNNNIIVLDCLFSSLTDTSTPANSIKVYNLRDLTKLPKIKTVSAVGDDEFGGTLSGRVKVEIDNTGEVSYTEDVVSEMKITYSYNDNGVVVNEEMLFNIGVTGGELSSPVSSVDALLDIEGNVISNFQSKFELTRTGLENTTAEVCTVKLKNLGNYYNGYRIGVKYTSNKTLRLLRDALLNDENRIVTADIIGMEARAVPVNLQFRFKPQAYLTGSDMKFIENKVKASVISFFSNYKLGDQIEASDIVGWLYTDQSVQEVIQYVALPFDAFYIPKDINIEEPIEGTEKVPADGVLPIQRIEYPLLNSSKFKITAI